MTADRVLTVDDATGLLTDAIRAVAPDADLAAADPDGLLQEELGLDSIDFLSIVDAVHDMTGFGIPERDFPELSTFRGFVAYLAGRRT
jgi:acyl carrier protein